MNSYKYHKFKEWALENGYNDNLTIERKDNNGNYEPSNCTWIPLGEQQLNKSTTKYITAFGETKSFQEWLKDPRCKVKENVLRERINKYKWSSEDAISIPKMKKGTKYVRSTIQVP